MTKYNSGIELTSLTCPLVGFMLNESSVCLSLPQSTTHSCYPACSKYKISWMTSIRPPSYTKLRSGPQLEYVCFTLSHQVIRQDNLHHPLSPTLLEAWHFAYQIFFPSFLIKKKYFFFFQGFFLFFFAIASIP